MWTSAEEEDEGEDEAAMDLRITRGITRARRVKLTMALAESM